MKKFWWLFLACMFLAQLSWAQFYTRLPAAERKVLAEDYYLVAQQYRASGKPDKAREFEQMAFNIDPTLDPSKIQLKEQPSAAELMLEGRARLAAVPSRAPGVDELIKTRFLQLVANFLTEDTDALLTLLDGSVYFTTLDRSLTYDQMRGQLQSFFTRASLGGLVPTQVFDLSSLVIEPAGAEANRYWGPAYSLRIRARMDFSAQVAFWEQDQRYLYHQRDGEWVIFSVGQGLPPASFRPAAPPKAEPREEPLLMEIPAATLKEDFQSCIGYFLDKNLDRTMSYFADEIHIIRMNATLTHRELTETFRGYFESASFGGATVKDVLDQNSIFVEPSDRFASQVAGPVYLLTVKTRVDLSDAIPFWTRFQDYYFRKVGDSWKIFAIF